MVICLIIFNCLAACDKAALSVVIFFLCAELMGIAVRLNDNIKGIQISDKNHVKITQFADDTTLILDGSKEYIVSAVKVIESN